MMAISKQRPVASDERAKPEPDDATTNPHLGAALRAAAAARARTARIRAMQATPEPVPALRAVAAPEVAPPLPVTRPAEPAGAPPAATTTPPHVVETPASEAPPPAPPKRNDPTDETGVRRAPTGLTVTEAACASRIAFRPLRQSRDAPPYRTEYRPRSSPWRTHWCGVGPAPDPNDYWPQVRDRLVDDLVAVARSKPAIRAPKPSSAPTQPETSRVEPAMSKPQIDARKPPIAAPTEHPIERIGSLRPSRAPSGRTTGTEPPAKGRGRFQRTIAELERLREAAAQPSRQGPGARLSKPQSRS